MRYLMLGAILTVLIFGSPRDSRAAAMDHYPAGTYQQSCRDISLRGDDLRARCRDNRGHYHDTSLDGADRCWGDISNSDGHLVCNKNGSMPSGAYSQTCRDIRVRYNVLRARCQDRDGRWTDTALESFSSCRTGIENINGQLRCMEDRRDRDYDRGYAPRGSYSQTCREIHAQGNSLRAVCQTDGGNWVGASLNDFDRCVGEIVNDDGRLECTRRGGRLVPAGSYSQSCRNIYVRGDNLRAQCQERDGGWRWSELHDWDDCRRGIVNENGNLRCVR